MKNPLGKTRYFGLHGAARAWLASTLKASSPHLTLIVRDKRYAEEIVDDLKFFLGDFPVRSIPGWDTLPFESVSPQTLISADRIRSLYELKTSTEGVTVIAADTLMQRVLPEGIINSLSFSLRSGERIDRDELIQKLDRCGFLPVSLVEEVGEVAVRGGVIDFFPSTSSDPIRLEFLDDVIEKIRVFDADSQRSIGERTEIFVLPVREIVRFDTTSPFHGLLHDALLRIKARGKHLETPPREIAKVLNAFRASADLPGMELYQYIALQNTASVFECIPRYSTVAVLEEISLHQQLDDLWAQIEDREKRLSEDHYLIPSKEALFLSPTEIISQIDERASVYIDEIELFTADESRIKSKKIVSLSNVELVTRLKTKIGTGDALKPLEDQVQSWRRKGFSVAFVVGSEGRAERLKKQLLDLNSDARIESRTGLEWMENPNRYPMVILKGHLSEGVQIPGEKVAFVAENEVFAERSYRRSVRSKYSLKRLLSSLAQLNEGDYVVHSDYGVGLYRGLKHIEVEDAEGDFLHIEYADSRLYLPVQNIGKIQKFVAAEGQSPALDKLASNRWIKTKQKVRESVATLAGDLIKLYAARSVAKGWRFEPFGAEDERFADGFAYDETPDQRKAIEDTIGDMSLDKTMDRLVCGDVGFGKTEVAIRAAFKCVQHARQVAVLVPTTILVEQHKQSFINRFQGYPVKIGAVSRFYDAKANKRTLEELASGDLDIVIGTHRLLSRDVQFKDVGLLIIDEEHRFGVKQKEKLKALKRSVDVLTLTATPIPRTLHMSLLGIRDISIISTPPQDRRVIRTYIANQDETIIRDAILREVQRGGQCFFIHNRVQSIDLVTAELQHLVPEAKFRFAHGQMSEHELEGIMKQFIDRSIDVLVSTTIVESGLDIPNANTIIIDRADAFGLAQLYQLRGRVGRSTRQAYAYFLIPKTRKLGLDAQKRLKALQSLDDLGLGFNLAVRDMEIRGAGNLLGKEQSGSVLAVGFELYSKILKEAVLNLKGEELDLEETVDPEVKIGVNAFIPEHYIPDVSERLVLYQRLAAIQSNEEAYELRLEIEDRFGPIGKEVSALIELMRFRALLRHFGVVKAEYSSPKLTLSFSKRAPIEVHKIFELVKMNPNKFKFTKNLMFSITLDNPSVIDASELYPVTWEVLHRIEQVEDPQPSDQRVVTRLDSA